MRMILLRMGLMVFFASSTVAVEAPIFNELATKICIQNKIDSVAFRILNANKVDKRLVFAYNDEAMKNFMLADKTLTRRRVVIYSNQIEHVSDENELAAFLSREIVKGSLTYQGAFRGWLSAAQMKAAPKKYELLYDKRGIDYMVNAGYNPVAMIVYLNKSGDQKRFALPFSRNKVSKRLAEIYECIYVKYPQYLANNEYLTNPYYQNFLLTSEANRAMFKEKIETNSMKRLKYE